MKLSIVIPVYNEESTLRQIVQAVTTVDLTSLGLEREIILVDDSSTDGSLEVARQLLDEDLVHQVVTHEYNQGKGAALRRAVRAQTARGVRIGTRTRCSNNHSTGRWRGRVRW